MLVDHILLSTNRYRHVRDLSREPQVLAVSASSITLRSVTHYSPATMIEVIDCSALTPVVPLAKSL